MLSILEFLFNTREGFAILFFGGIAFFILLAYLLERRTNKIYVDRGEKTDDDDDEGWHLFD